MAAESLVRGRLRHTRGCPRPPELPSRERTVSVLWLTTRSIRVQRPHYTPPMPHGRKFTDVHRNGLTRLALLCGTGRGTAGHEIPVQPALQVRSVALSVQVRQSMREGRPLVMRRQPDSECVLPLILATYVARRRDAVSRHWVMSTTTRLSAVSGSLQSPIGYSERT